jgi:hypothetical protein
VVKQQVKTSAGAAAAAAATALLKHPSVKPRAHQVGMPRLHLTPSIMHHAAPISSLIKK